jgi:hypothetical protein
MPLDADTVRDLWRITPGTEAIVLKKRRPNAQLTFDEYPVPNAKRERRPGTFDYSRAGRYDNRQAVVWKIWIDQLPEGIVPEHDDLIVDPDGITWSVEEVEKQLIFTRYRCTCLKAEGS